MSRLFPVLLSLLLTTISLVHAAESAVILQYHHFSDTTPRSTSISPERFEQQLNYLEQNDFTVWPLQRVVDAVLQGDVVPDKTIAITVDDAYDSIYSEAWPRLKRRGWSMTVFVNSDAVDSGLRPYLSWEQMREMQRSGVAFANHTASHDHLIRRRAGEPESQWRLRVIADIDKAQQRLQEELGRAPKLFVYPYGEYDYALRQLVGELGYVGFGQQSGPIGPLSDRRALPRFPMAGPYTEMAGFIEKLNTLPLPVNGQGEVDPLLPNQLELPILSLKLNAGAFNPDAISCFITGQGKGDVSYQAGLLTVMAKSALPVGRSRYNCTVRHNKMNRYFWYSQNWIRRNSDGSWYRE
ncbi:hypothetical protein BOW53_12920 [Solemya pervernicosa gill symbiont]|uniref:NodB homology domain-containing protein n=2 Tax=Gammaproteobacteria incertae sedis TaxID=118884 RepID=A0A1T2L1Z5_9GAMM|nr:hypothetical protein BOW53_12920 [Solemya pervernicosa gill symbiont]